MQTMFVVWWQAHFSWTEKMAAAAAADSGWHGDVSQAKRKRDRMGDLKIVVAGCVAQQEGQQLLRRVPEVDLVMGELGPCHGWQWQWLASPQYVINSIQLVDRATQFSQCATPSLR